MITFLFRTVMYLASAGLGLIVADLVLEGFRIQWDQWWGFVICIVIFAILQSVLSPWIAKLADRYAPVLLGGIGIFSTLIAQRSEKISAPCRAAHRACRRAAHRCAPLSRARCGLHSR